MTAIRSIHVAALAALLALPACAGAPKDPAPDAAPAPGVEAPQMVPGGPPLALRAPVSGSGRASTRLDVEVMVDELGRPDMNTFKLFGPGADINREAVRTWLAGSTFRPARLDGRAVPALYKTHLETGRRSR